MKYITKANQKILLSVLSLVAVVLVGMPVATDASDQITKNQSPIYLSSPKQQLEEFYASQNQHYYDHIPENLLQKYKETIKQIDKYILDNNVQGGTFSQAENFSLNLYIKTIQVGILPYIKDSHEFANQVNNFVAESLNYTLDREKITQENRSKYGDHDPVPMIFDPYHPLSDRDKQDTSAYNSVPNHSLVGSGYNASKAVQYAYDWTENGKKLRNSAYNYYTVDMNDCTNFVSQVLHDSSAGGLPKARKDLFGPDFWYTENWYYGPNSLDRPSHTWGGAPNFYDHLAYYSSNIRRVYSPYDLQVGDIIQWDFTPSDGVFNVDHTTVVTKIAGGMIYLTYHTTDKEDEPIFTFAGASAYPWAVNH